MYNDFDEETIKKIKKIAIISVILIFVLITILCSFKTIKSGEVGIRTRFGKVVNTEMSEGINFKIPFIEKIEKMNIKVQKLEIESESASKDLQDVELQIAVNYRVNADNATNLYKNVGNKYKETILDPAIKESVKSAISKFTAEELITKRVEVSKICLDTLQEKVAKYGLTIEDFNITNFNFSKEFNKAIEEKQVAEQKVLTAKQELEKEKIEAEKKIVKAKAEKQANALKEKSLTKNIIEEKFIEKWDGKLPVVTSNNSFLDISKYLK